MSGGQCEICSAEVSKYCCPRCSILYCSLRCYKDQKHAQCSEEFYKEAVIAELKEQTQGEEGRGQMLDVLKRLEENTDFLDDPLDPTEEGPETVDSDDEDDTDLADRLKGIDLDNGDAVWEKLTDAEREQFKSLVDSGDIMGLLPEKEPWYITGTGVPTVVLSKITLYSKLSSRPPAATVRFNLVNVLAAYSYMTRYFLCDQESFLLEACSCLCALSGALLRNCDFNDLDMAVKSLFVEGISHQFEMDEEMHPTLLSDVEKLIAGPRSSAAEGSHTTMITEINSGGEVASSEASSYILAALSDMVQMFKKAKKLSLTPTDRTPVSGPFNKQFSDSAIRVSNTLTPTTFTQTVKRLEYFLSYTKSYYSAEIVQLIH